MFPLTPFLSRLVSAANWVQLSNWIPKLISLLLLRTTQKKRGVLTSEYRGIEISLHCLSRATMPSQILRHALVGQVYVVGDLQLIRTLLSSRSILSNAAIVAIRRSWSAVLAPDRTQSWILESNAGMLSLMNCTTTRRWACATIEMQCFRRSMIPLNLR